MQQQQDDFMTRYKRNFNIAYSVLLIHQRAIIIPIRERFGKEILGLPCALSLALMCGWAALSRDVFMWVWVAIWIVSLAKRKNESAQLAQKGVVIHSRYDGWPTEAIKYGRTEKIAKLVVEPIIVGVLGAVLFLIYQGAGLPIYGLPYFFLIGVASLVFEEKFKQLTWERRIQGVQDARIEQEALMRDVRERNGE